MEDSFWRSLEEIDPEEHVLATYYLQTSLEFNRAAEALAAEQSTGTWTRAEFETTGLRANYSAKIIRVELQKSGAVNEGIVTLAFPYINFGPVTPMLLSTVAGNLYEMGAFPNIKLIDLRFPKSFVENFKGPKFGGEGTRKAIGVEERPLIGTIVKPCVGLDPKKLAGACYKVAVGGVDFVKDDELYSPKAAYSPLEERVIRVMEALDKACEKTGEETLYAVNITDEVDRIIGNAELAIENGANCIMLNFITAGFSALRVLAADPSINVPIHCHRDMFAAFTRPKKHGIETNVVSRLARLCGGDQVHVGAIFGKLYEDNQAVVGSAEVLREPFYGLKSAMPVSSGGQHAGKIPANVRFLGQDCLVLAGGGIFGHPDGAVAGARSMRQALDAVMNGVALTEAAEEQAELWSAIEKWGIME